MTRYEMRFTPSERKVYTTLAEKKKIPLSLWIRQAMALRAGRELPLCKKSRVLLRNIERTVGRTP